MHVSSVLEHIQKLLTINASIAVLVSLPDHLVDLVVGQLLADGGHDVTQFGGRDETVVIAVEDLERFSDLLLRVGVLHLAGHHGKEFCHYISHHPVSDEMLDRTGEVNCAVVVGVNLVDHVLKLRLAGVLAEGAHDGAQFLGGDLTCDAASSVTRSLWGTCDAASDNEGGRRADGQPRHVRDTEVRKMSPCIIVLGAERGVH